MSATKHECHEAILRIQADIEYLRMALDGAPADPGRMAPDLIGWITASGVFVCAHCAGRVMARGCRMPDDAEPCWRDWRAAPCDLCGCMAGAS